MVSKPVVALAALLLCASAALLPRPALAAEEHAAPAAAEHPRFELETSPQFVPMKGAHLEAAVRLAGRLRIGIAAFTLEIPELFHGQDGWTVRHYGTALTANVFLYQATRGGLFVGAQVAPHVHTYARVSTSKQIEEIDVGLRGGYQWFPAARFDGYVMAYVGATAPIYRSEVPVIDGNTFQHKPVNVFPVVALGWQFQ
jgi:hypothetical protein